MNEITQFLVEKFDERPIVYQRIYTQICKSVNAGLVLSQLVYWASVMKWKEFYKIDRELREDIGLTKAEFATAKKIIKSMPFIKVKPKKKLSKTHYKINRKKLTEAISSFLGNRKPVIRTPSIKLSGILESSYQESCQPVTRNHDNSYTKIKTQITEHSSDIQNENISRKQKGGFMEQLKFSEEDVETAKFIFSRIKTVHPGFKKPDLNSWANQIRLMLERDGHNRENIKILFTWANNDHFWQSIILSPSKLRKQWDTLEIKRLSNNNGKRYRTQAEINTPRNGEVIV